MYIERVQVEEGFLDGLDVSFTSGLNVIIGARGTGKTSIIELIRFCLNADSSSEQNRRSREHALSILGSGQVTVTLNDNDQIIVVTRTANDSISRSTGDFEIPLVFSQTEIETIGLESAGRIRLIDTFLSEDINNSAQEEKVVSEVHSITVAIESVQRDIDDLEKQLSTLPLINEELQKLEVEETSVSDTSIELKNKTVLLQSLSEDISRFAVMEEQGKIIQNDLAIWYNLIRKADEYQVNTNNLPPEALTLLYPKIEEATKQISQALQNVLSVWQFFNAQSADLNSKRIDAESEARTLRQDVEAIQTGAGNLMRRIQELRQTQAKMLSLNAYYNAKKTNLADLYVKRDEALDRLDEMRSERFKQRSSVVRRLNLALEPIIKIDLIRNGQQSSFFSILTEMLRGAGLRYGDVAKTLSEHISPRALLEAIDTFNVDLISDIAQISKDRATRVLAQFRNSFLGGLGTMYLDDDVSFQLLDGTDYKDLSALSTGQRCTVILPLVLAHRDKILIVDQPEDHIDNAFITNTLIKSILDRASEGQIIFSTHNPNIPVLGNADNVLHLGSDGKHGYVEALGPLNDPKIVKAISTVMEGGEQAFSSRADFYNQFKNKFI